MLAFIRRLESTYERVVSAADGLRGASRTTSNTNGSDGGAGEPDETLNVGEDEAEQTTELAERGGACLQGGRGVVVSTSAKARAKKSHHLGGVTTLELTTVALGVVGGDECNEGGDGEEGSKAGEHVLSVEE